MTSSFPLDRSGSFSFGEIREKIGYRASGRLIFVPENAGGSARAAGVQLQYLVRERADQYYQLLEAVKVHDLDAALV